MQGGGKGVHAVAAFTIVSSGQAYANPKSLEAETFIARSHAWLDEVRNHTEIAVDGERWLVGFVQGAPCPRGGAAHG